MKKSFIVTCLLVIACPAYALINLKFTPVQLAGAAKDIVQVEVGPLKANAAVAKVTGVLKGKLAAESLPLDLKETDETTLETFPKAGGVGLLFTGDFSGASSSGDVGADKPSAVLQVGTAWFALKEKNGKWSVEADPLDLNAVWSGGAAALADCVKYVLADPRADVPTQTGAQLIKDEKLGNIPGKVSDIKVLGFGKVLIQSDKGDYQLELPSKTLTKLQTTTAAPSGPRELVGDYDGDGVLDKIIAEPGGPKFLKSQTTDVTDTTAELDYHTRSKPDISHIAEGDVNCDGLPDFVVSYGKDLTPLVFFSRGFGCFGLARELTLQDSELESAKTLGDGQQASALVPLGADGSNALLSVLPNGDVRAIYTKLDRKAGPSVTVTATEPLTVSAKEGKRSLGARQLTPGTPVIIWMKNPGPLDLEWTHGNKKRVIAAKPVVVDLSQAE
jgi:hypothetical protein